MKTVPLGPFIGINNRLPPFALHVDKKGDFLLAADNVDVDNSGRVRSRLRTLKLHTLTNPHSLYMVSATAGYLVRASTLYAITLPSYTETLVKVLTTDAPLSYVLLDGELYYSNGTDGGRLTAGTWYPLGLPTPSAPGLAVTAGGSLGSAWYQVSVSYRNNTTGEEGGTSASSSIQLSAVGSIVVTLPAATPGATHVNVYVSGPNGEVPFLLASPTAGTATYTATGAAQGRETPGRFEVPLPPGTLFVHNAALCSFSGKNVFVGLPYRPGYCMEVESIIPFPAPVSVAVSGQTGVYIAADKTYWIPGALDAMEGAPVVDVLPFGAVPGTAFVVPDKPMVGWFSSAGVVLGDTQGQVTLPMKDNVTLTPPVSGVATVFVSDGYRRVTTCGWCMNLENGAATTYSGWEFTSLSGEYGTQADGVYSTAEDADDARTTVDLGRLDFGTDTLKQVPCAYLGAYAESPMELTASTPGGEEYVYLASQRSAPMAVQRVELGRGLRAAWFDIQISGTPGEVFILAGVSFAVVDTGRRI